MAGNAANIIENLQTENAALRRHIDNLTDAQAVMVKEFTEKLEELAQAEQDGRLVVLPSKTVWELTMDAGPDCDLFQSTLPLRGATAKMHKSSLVFL